MTSHIEPRIDCWVDEILDKVARGQATLDQITKSATRH
jgi:hypothetical protein